MKGYVQDIESIAVKNEEFRRVLYTSRNCQLVVMAPKPREDIGMEVHQLDQFFRVEEGTGEAGNRSERRLRDGQDKYTGRFLQQVRPWVPLGRS